MSAKLEVAHRQNRAEKCPFCGVRTRRGGLLHHKFAKHAPEMAALARDALEHFRSLRRSRPD
jgi:hypothetical protein